MRACQIDVSTASPGTDAKQQAGSALEDPGRVGMGKHPREEDVEGELVLDILWRHCLALCFVPEFRQKLGALTDQKYGR